MPETGIQDTGMPTRCHVAEGSKTAVDLKATKVHITVGQSSTTS